MSVCLSIYVFLLNYNNLFIAEKSNSDTDDEEAACALVAYVPLRTFNTDISFYFSLRLCFYFL